MDSIYKLQGVVQHYSWGGQYFLPSLIGVGNNEAKPFAEYWIGAHPSAPAVVEAEGSLPQLIASNAQQVLGKEVDTKFGTLPFLFKVLDVRQMLSIQVHPTKAAAEFEYRQESERGIPLQAPHRNYKDQNHKPELMAALGDFWLLHGFKPAAELNTTLQKVPELSFFAASFADGDYKALYEEVMTMPQEKVNDVLAPLLKRLMPQYESGELSKESEDFWAARAAATFCKDDLYDRGIFSIYLFNLLHLKRGDAIYQPAGLPHAYLEGQNIEVMAASDNVLRAGLTDKHIDVAELMKHVRFEATTPAVIFANGGSRQRFDSPAEEFLLLREVIENSSLLRCSEVAVHFVYEGEADFASSGKTIHLKKGEAILSLPGAEVQITPTAQLELYSVTVPAA